MDDYTHLPRSERDYEGWPWEAPHSPTLPEYAFSSKLPRISIVMPSYNQSKYIEQAIRSILLQNYPDLELFIEDGGSTDSTLEIIKKYEPWITHWRSSPDAGQADAINQGWKQATGDIFGWLNSDDVYAPGAFVRLADTWVQKPDTLMLYGDALIIDQDAKIVNQKQMNAYTSQKALMWETMPQPAVFVTPRLYKEVGPLDISLYYTLDVDFFIRSWLRSDLAHKFIYLGDVLAYSREYEQTKMSTGKSKIADEHVRVLFNYWTSQPPLFEKNIKSKYLFAVALIKQAIIYHRNGAFKEALSVYLRATIISPFCFPYMLKKAFFASLEYFEAKQ
jgi:glycosyltransferase involved in cell wall biosynthesis